MKKFILLTSLLIPVLSLAQPTPVTSNATATETLASLEMDLNQDGRNDLITVTRVGKTTALNIYLNAKNNNTSPSRQLLLSNTHLLNKFADDADITLQTDPMGGFVLVIESTTFLSEDHFVMGKGNSVSISHAKWIDRHSGLTIEEDWPKQTLSYQLPEQSPITIDRALPAQALNTLQRLPFAEDACLSDLPERCMQARTTALQPELTQSEQQLKTTMQQIYGGKSDSYEKSYLNAFDQYRHQDFTSWQTHRDAHCYQQFYIDGMNEREISPLAEQCRLSATLERLAQTQTAIKNLKNN